MTPLPLIVGFGGINAAGRSSDHQAFRRLIMDALSPSEKARTVDQIGALIGMGKETSMNEAQVQHILRIH